MALKQKAPDSEALRSFLSDLYQTALFRMQGALLFKEIALSQPLQVNLFQLTSNRVAFL